MTTDTDTETEKPTPTQTAPAVESSDLSAKNIALIEELAEHKDLLREWKKWADMGIEDLLPKWCAPVLHTTYEKTRDLIG